MEDYEVIRVVAEDLTFLRVEWDHEINDGSLRRSSPVLRRLVVEGDFGRAWRALGLSKEPLVQTPCLDRFLGPGSRSDVVVAHAGGAQYGGGAVRGVVQRSRALSSEEVKANYERAKDHQLRAFSLSRFRESLGMIVGGEEILRREIILYVCNKCGGSHFDPTRDDSKSLERKFKLLDEHQRALEILGKNAVYFELLSIGQAVANSTDAGFFLESSRHAMR